MATTQDLIENSTKQLGEMGVCDINAELLAAIAGRVPKTSVDATLVAATDDDELDYIVKNFMKKKLEENDEEKGRAALDAVMAKMKGQNRKQRAVVYYVLTVEYGKESVYV